MNVSDVMTMMRTVAMKATQAARCTAVVRSVMLSSQNKMPHCVNAGYARLANGTTFPSSHLLGSFRSFPSQPMKPAIEPSTLADGERDAPAQQPRGAVANREPC